MPGPSPEPLIDAALTTDRHVLLFGAPGVGKSTLAGDLARVLAQAGRRCACIGADPGSPAFGIPGALCYGEWRKDAWQLLQVAALCSLDAGRFRLPLVSALRRISDREVAGTLLIDGPGVARGVAGAELLPAIIEAAGVDVVLALVRDKDPLPLRRELEVLPVEVLVVQAAAAARRPGKRTRARRRTGLWQTYLQHAAERSISLKDLKVVGTPPPLDAVEAWVGRQVALLDRHGTTLALGEVTAKNDDGLRVKMPLLSRAPDLLLVRDAQRTSDGWLGSAQPGPSAAVRYAPPPDMTARPGLGLAGGPRPVAQVGPATVTLVNGIFGDPLLHLRLRQQKRSLLFDLGEAGRLPARIAHQVTDVFISHAHIDHIAGFTWLLRSRIGELPPCRVYGPPGLTDNIKGLMRGVHWDRVGDRGPRFQVAELHDQRLVSTRIQAGRPRVERLGEQVILGGILMEESGFRVRAVTLDHGTPVVAFAFEPSRQLKIRAEGLSARGLQPGPWLGDLKRCVTSGQLDEPIELPGGCAELAGSLAQELITVIPPQKLVYATDLADTADNRNRLAGLARGAHTFFCEAAFVAEDADQAKRTRHLTARACGEIAAAARTERLVPFHLSRRYVQAPDRVFEEVQAACPRTVVPPSLESSIWTL